MNFPTTVGNLKASRVCWRESTRRVQLSGNQVTVDRVQCVAVEDLVLSQEDKPKRHQSAREISHETAILRSSVFSQTNLCLSGKMVIRMLAVTSSLIGLYFLFVSWNCCMRGVMKIALSVFGMNQVETVISLVNTDVQSRSVRRSTDRRDCVERPCYSARRRPADQSRRRRSTRLLAQQAQTGPVSR